MKIKPEHYNQLKDTMDKSMSINPNVVDIYETGRFDRSEKVNDLQMRFCFDMYWLCTRSDFRRELMEYMNDVNVYTALKRILPKVVRRY